MDGFIEEGAQVDVAGAGEEEEVGLVDERLFGDDLVGFAAFDALDGGFYFGEVVGVEAEDDFELVHADPVGAMAVGELLDFIDGLLGGGVVADEDIGGDAIEVKATARTGWDWKRKRIHKVNSILADVGDSLWVVGEFEEKEIKLEAHELKVHAGNILCV